MARRPWLAAAVLAGIFCFTGLSNHPLRASDEPRVAGIAWEMQHGTSAPIPHLGGAPAQRAGRVSHAAPRLRSGAARCEPARRALRGTGAGRAAHLLPLQPQGARRSDARVVRSARLLRLRARRLVFGRPRYPERGRRRRRGVGGGHLRHLPRGGARLLRQGAGGNPGDRRAHRRGRAPVSPLPGASLRRTPGGPAAAARRLRLVARAAPRARRRRGPSRVPAPERPVSDRSGCVARELSRRTRAALLVLPRASPRAAQLVDRRRAGRRGLGSPRRVSTRVECRGDPFPGPRLSTGHVAAEHSRHQARGVSAALRASPRGRSRGVGGGDAPLGRGQVPRRARGRVAFRAARG